MKKHTEKPPIDDLFTRKLGNALLPPSRDGFERLQSRMKQNAAESRVVFWRNPGVQRYMAVAACLLLVCLLGWLYLAQQTSTDGQLASTTLSPEKSPNKIQPQRPDMDRGSGTSESTDSQLATTPQANKANGFVASGQPPKRADRQVSETAAAPNVEAQTLPVTGKPSTNVPSATEAMAISEPVASATPNLSPVAERVLVVTIAEPTSLVAARQTAVESVDTKTLVAVNDKANKNEKEPQAGSLWQQVNRIRQGEVFARRDNSDDERGLLGRAYSGLKHSLEKDKPTKQ